MVFFVFKAITTLYFTNIFDFVMTECAHNRSQFDGEKFRWHSYFINPQSRIVWNVIRGVEIYLLSRCTYGIKQLFPGRAQVEVLLTPLVHNRNQSSSNINVGYRIYLINSCNHESSIYIFMHKLSFSSYFRTRVHTGHWLKLYYDPFCVEYDQLIIDLDW